MNNRALDIFKNISEQQHLPKVLLGFDVHLSDHCNLNCCNCNHYSSISEEEYLDIEEYEKDIKRLSEIFESEMSYINLMGGEPLLNKNIVPIMKITRKYFSVGTIKVVTNGILLDKMSDEFWDTCKEEKIQIWITKYPINLDYSKIRKDIEKRGIVSGAFSTKGEEGKQRMWRFTLDTRGIYDPNWNFHHCFFANKCIQLKHGRLYTCNVCANANHLNEKFNVGLSISNRNSINIYEENDPDLILQKLSKPIPFCRYCDFSSISDYEDDWHVSYRDKYEWISFVFGKEDIEYLKTYNNVYIYGAGKWGVNSYLKLKQMGIIVTSFLVESMEGNCEKIEDVNVLSMDKFSSVEQNSVCIIAVAGNAKIEIQHKLVNKGFKNIIPLFHEP